MFFYQRKYKEVQVKKIKMRDEWGVLHNFEIVRGIPLLTDQEPVSYTHLTLPTILLV